MNEEQHHSAADPQTKPTNLDSKFTFRMLLSTSTNHQYLALLILKADTRFTIPPLIYVENG